MKENEQKIPRLVIENRGYGPMYEKQFFLDIEEAILKGYRIAKNDMMKDVTMRNYNGVMGRAVLYLDGDENYLMNSKPATQVVKENPIPKADIEEIAKKIEEEYSADKLASLTKKAELLKYAGVLELGIPKEFTNAQQIKKYIKDFYKQ